MGFSSAKEYEKAAAAVVANSSALHKKEAEDGDDVYYIESTNEFVIVSTDGYIRTYFNPDTGIAYYNRQ
jgi:pyocin large subunit-like protein